MSSEVYDRQYDLRLKVMCRIHHFCDASGNVQGGREVTVHPENTHLRLNISLRCTAQHAVQCKMVGWQQCAR